MTCVKCKIGASFSDTSIVVFVRGEPLCYIEFVIFQLYAAGDNSFGQLGVGRSWRGAVGEAATAGGALLAASLVPQVPLQCLAAGHYHSAAVDVGGRLYTWGYGYKQINLTNFFVQFSNGTNRMPTCC